MTTLPVALAELDALTAEKEAWRAERDGLYCRIEELTTEVQELRDQYNVPRCPCGLKTRPGSCGWCEE